MNVLSIDSSKDGRFSVAILKNGSINFSKTMETRLSEALFHVLNPLRDEILTQIDVLAINAGPGSYTGIRAGIGILKGISIGSGKKLIGFDSFTILLSKFKRDYHESGFDEREIAVLLRGYNDSFFYLQKFGKNFRKKTDPTRISADLVAELKEYTIISDTPGYSYVCETSADDISLLASDMVLEESNYSITPLYL